MIAKRPTKKIRAAGIELNIVRGVYGFSPTNPKLNSQKSICFKTSEEAVNAVLSGFRPTEIKRWE